MHELRPHIIPLTNEELDSNGDPVKPYDVTPMEFAQLVDRVNLISSAHLDDRNDFRLVTRPAERDDRQRWVFLPYSGDTFTVQQLANGRYVDAHTSPSHAFAVVTRPAQNDDTQRWVVRAASTR
ncbi:hypothetical protein [Nocardia xishanensis]|uniref:Ricin B lectin domain-containing protein n=1 Tax=Nocardia xishanensis TaxID=238964 RepID=A0ABW7WZS2_9NOCA